MKRLIGLAASLCVEWALIGDTWELVGTTALPVETVTDATVEPGKAHLKQQRLAAYHALLDRVERTGRPEIYESRGPADDGWMLPRGRYRIERRESDGMAGYEEIVEPKRPSYLTPIPTPDPATIRNFRMVPVVKQSLTVDECVT